MIDSITIAPRDARRGVDIELTGHLAAMLEVATGKTTKSCTSKGMRLGGSGSHTIHLMAC